MKFIHLADVHLGSEMKRFATTNAGERNREVMAAFLKVVDYARENGIKTIVIAGDLFDSNAPLDNDKDVLYSAVKRNENINFLYLRGNHDDVLELDLPNLHLFGEKPTSYEIDDVVFTGVEIIEDNASNFYDEIHLDESKKNVLILHGEASSSSGVDKIDISRLKEKGVDYLALGHIHKYYEGNVDTRGVYVNPGCLEGRGFDECGEKGFVVVDSEDFSHEFIVNSIRVIREVEVDLSGTQSVYEAVEKVKNEMTVSQKDVIRLVLKGALTYASDVGKTVNQCINDIWYYLDVKDETYRAIDVNDYLNDVSIKGEFVRLTLADDKTTEAEKRKILSLGLSLLEGRKI